jgi:hypothetical protein
MMNKAIVLITLFLIGCNKNAVQENNPALIKSQTELTNNWDGTLFFNKADNPFLQKIPSNYSIHPNSARMIDLIKKSCGPTFSNVYVNANDYSIPVYLADNSSPKRSIKITLYNKPPNLESMINVPVPQGASAAGGTDKHMAIINTENKCLYEFWLFEDTKAGSGNGISVNSNGIYADGRSTVAAGWSQLQGLIWPKELKQGLINHALSFSVSVTNANGFVIPATNNDGALSNNPDAIPEGTLIRIKPNVIINDIPGITETEKIIYKALQQYGMYCGDTNGGGLSIRAAHTKSFLKDAYSPAMQFDATYGNFSLKNFPFDLLEVVYTGALQTKTTKPYMNQGCAEWK